MCREYPADGKRRDGTAIYREPMALPPEAVFEASIEDVSRAPMRRRS